MERDPRPASYMRFSREHDYVADDQATAVAMEFQELCKNSPDNTDVINKKFEEFVRLTYEDLHAGLASTPGLNNDDIHDILQNTYLKSFQALSKGRFEGRSKASSYLYRAMINNRLKHHTRTIRRKEQSLEDMEGYEPADNIDVENQTIESDDSELLRLIEALPIHDRDKRILYLSEVEGYSHKEISKMLAAGAVGGAAIYLSVNAIKVAVSRARAKARATIQEV